MDIELVYYDDNWERDPDGLNWRGVREVELADQSLVIDDVWFKIVAGWGDTTWTMWADVRNGHGVDNSGEQSTASRDWWDINPGTRMVRVQGRRESPQTLISASVLPRAK